MNWAFHQRNLMGDNSEHDDKFGTADTAHDRRRPGRRAYTDQSLIALLRGEPSSRPVKDTKDAPMPGDASLSAPGDSDLAPVVGILVSVGLGILLWAIIILMLWLFLHS
jgi:hypothetical protein